MPSLLPSVLVPAWPELSLMVLVLVEPVPSLPSPASVPACLADLVMQVPSLPLPALVPGCLT